jgi:alkylresorcinol/alkylpyrone synthase
MNETNSNEHSPCLISLATAVPCFEIGQPEVQAFGKRLFKRRPETFERLSGAYSNAGIDRRYSCVPLGWYEQEHGWKDRTELFVENALELLTNAATEALEEAGLSPDQIDGLVTVSSTGIAVPSLDALLMERLPFRRDLQRLPVFGLGCCGGVLGLSRTAALAKAQPGSRWLLLVVELCGLTFRATDLSKSNIIATALFGDGAAAGIVETREIGHRISATGEYCWPDSLDVMGWEIEEDGLGVQFSRDIPHLVRTELRSAADRFLSSAEIPFNAIDHFVFHPGGAKVLTALEEAFEIDAPGLVVGRSILREFGNMSAATVLFVLKRILEKPISGRSLLGALGPGFTAGFAVMEHN